MICHTLLKVRPFPPQLPALRSTICRPVLPILLDYEVNGIRRIFRTLSEIGIPQTSTSSILFRRFSCESCLRQRRNLGGLTVLVEPRAILYQSRISVQASRDFATFDVACS
jgi:hypothetical protein